MKDDIDRQFEIDLHTIDSYQNRSITYLELRYQVALIIMTTIVGVWGFLGIIVTSDNISNKFTIYLLINLAILITIFLIYIWRLWVHDIYQEEVNAGSFVWKLLIQYNNLSSVIQEGFSESLINKKVKKADPDFYNYLKKGHGSIKEKVDFYTEFRNKLSISGFLLFDTISIAIIIIFGVAGLLSLDLLSFLVFDEVYSVSRSHGWIYDGTRLVILFFMIFFSFQIFKLMLRVFFLTKNDFMNTKTDLYQKFLTNKNGGGK